MSTFQMKLAQNRAQRRLHIVARPSGVSSSPLASSYIFAASGGSSVGAFMGDVQFDEGPPSRRLRNAMAVDGGTPAWSIRSVDAATGAVDSDPISAVCDEGVATAAHDGPSRRLRTDLPVVNYKATPPSTQRSVVNEHVGDRYGGSTALAVSSPPAKSSWSVAAHLKGSGCSKCRWRGCRSCPDAGASANRCRETDEGKQPASTAAHDAPTLAANAKCGTCVNCLDMKCFGGSGIRKRRCSSADAEDAPTPPAKRQKQGTVSAEDAVEGSTSSGARPLPPGWSAVAHTSPSRTYNVYHGPGGKTTRSMIEAWRTHGEEQAAEAEEEAAEATPPAKRLKHRPDGADEGPPPLMLPHGRAQAGLQDLRDLEASVPHLRRQIVSATPRRGAHDPKQTCTNSDLALLLGIKKKSFYKLRSALREGRLPAKLLAPDKTWVDSAECATRLHDARFWVEKRGIVEIATLREKLDGQSAARRGQAQAQRQVLGSPIGMPIGEIGEQSMSDATAPEGVSATPLPQAARLALNWRDEEDELKRTVMVSALHDRP